MSGVHVFFCCGYAAKLMCGLDETKLTHLMLMCVDVRAFLLVCIISAFNYYSFLSEIYSWKVVNPIFFTSVFV